MLGTIDGVQERFYVITAQRRLKHPLVAAILENAQRGLFGLLDGVGRDGDSSGEI